MDIVIQSVLEQARRLRLSMHLRYLHPDGARTHPRAPGVWIGNGSRIAMSYVIIHRSYQYLEPVVRQLFRQAADVEVLVDRRWHERRGVHRARPEERRLGPDRRVAAPMLDILVNVG